METTKPRRPRKTAEQWAQVLAEYRQSGQTQAVFARSREVGVGALRNWLYRTRGVVRKPEGARGGGGSCGFVPVRLRGEHAVRGEGGLCAGKPQLVVRWAQGVSVEVHVAPSTPGVAELIGTLLGPCSR